MQQNIPTDEEWIRLDLESKRWWSRVYQLVHESGCDITTAIKAVRAADAEHPARTN